ncbi:MAG: D-alanyl-D-alanine carboxypeptidase [Clostridia bacterium]|nr:D-alanyl-D-alanine carboxypeptidase [Clostridia bacterium]
MKKIISVILCIIITAGCIPALAEGEQLELTCPSALLMEFSTGQILYEKDSHAKLPMASVTKIMTMLLAMEAVDSGKITFDDMVIGSAYAKSMGGSTIFLDEGEQLSVRDILKGIAVASGNDAAVAMGEHLAGSAEGFVAMMNSRAAELGMNDTHFVNCNGLDADGHYSSAYDIALMSRELMKHEDIFQFTTIWMDSLRNGAFTLSNTNKLIRFYDGATGLKTGSTDKAKFCISATAKRDGMHLIAVIMAAPTSKERSADASKLLNYGFSNYGLSEIVKKGEVVGTVHVDKGIEEMVNVVSSEDINILYQKSKRPETKREVIIDEPITAPRLAGERAGEITVSSDGTEIARCPVVFEADVPKMSAAGIFVMIFRKWITI